MPRRSRVLAALVVVLALALLASGCSKNEKDKEGADGAGAGTTTSAPSGAADRAPLIVKIDNSPAAGHEQIGLNDADVVVEQMVEGGQTRFAAIYQSKDAAEIGPVRSARSSDVNYFSSVSRPLFAYSGANSFFKVLVRKSVFFDVGFERHPDAYARRDAGLYTSTKALYDKAPGIPASQLNLWGERAKGAPAGAPAAQRVDVEFKGPAATRVQWRWEPEFGVYVRWQNGVFQLEKGGAPVRTENVVIQFSEYKDSAARDSSGAPVPEIVAVGAGEAWVLTEGKLVKGRWTRTSVTKPVAFTDQEGKPLALPPGRTWIELPTPGSAKESA